MGGYGPHLGVQLLLQPRKRGVDLGGQLSLRDRQLLLLGLQRLARLPLQVLHHLHLAWKEGRWAGMWGSEQAMCTGRRGCQAVG